jgi:hypothetical protein
VFFWEGQAGDLPSAEGVRAVPGFEKYFGKEHALPDESSAQFLENSGDVFRLLRVWRSRRKLIKKPVKDRNFQEVWNYVPHRVSCYVGESQLGTFTVPTFTQAAKIVVEYPRDDGVFSIVKNNRNL